jgi:hypothetical protein
MTAAGAPPPATAEGMNGPEGYLSWLQSVEIKGDFAPEHRPLGGSAESRAVAACLAPFFEQVEKALAEPRAEYIEKHREELVELQREYASFDLPND